MKADNYDNMNKQDLLVEMRKRGYTEVSILHLAKRGSVTMRTSLRNDDVHDVITKLAKGQ